MAMQKDPELREPDVMRIAPAPLYNTFSDVCEFVDLVKRCVQECREEDERNCKLDALHAEVAGCADLRGEWILSTFHVGSRPQLM